MRPRFLILLSALFWSGPQFPFMSRYLRPGGTMRENPRRIPAWDTITILPIQSAVVMAAMLLCALALAVFPPTASQRP